MAAADSIDLEWGSHWPLKQHYVTASLLPWECGSLDQKKARSALLWYTCDAPFKDVTDAITQKCEAKKAEGIKKDKKINRNGKKMLETIHRKPTAHLLSKCLH